jgi:hypothetical protein
MEYIERIRVFVTQNEIDKTAQQVLRSGLLLLRKSAVTVELNLKQNLPGTIVDALNQIPPKTLQSLIQAVILYICISVVSATAKQVFKNVFVLLQLAVVLLLLFWYMQ